MYFLSLLFFTLPLYFSHVFSPFGLVIWGAYSFERQKIYVFLIILLFAYIEGLMQFSKSIINICNKYMYVLTILVISPFLSILYYWWRLDAVFFIGSYEKHHWYVFYFSIIAFAVLLVASPKAYLRKYLTWSIFSSVLVAGIAIWENSEWILDIYRRSEMLSMYPGRTSSTLGNPNYLAGFLLPFVPILTQSIYTLKDKYWKQVRVFMSSICMLWIILGWIYTTGSYIAVFLVWLLGLWYCLIYLMRSIPFWRQVIVLFFCFVAFIFVLLYCIEPIKFLSLESRFILMKEISYVMLQHPLSFFLGFWPDSILLYFSQIRSSLVNLYFPSGMLIDSSHNLLIDILFQYGIIPIFLLFFFLYQVRKHILSSVGIGILLVLLFLLLNVFIITHIVLLILLIVYISRTSNASK